MKKCLVLLTVIYFAHYSASAQTPISDKDNFITDKAIYLKYESNKLGFFKTGDADGVEPLKSVHRFELKGNFSNIYFNWLNPLKYHISWVDTSYADDRDKTVEDFMSLFVGQFGSDLSDLNTKSKVNLMEKYNLSVAFTPGSDTLYSPENFTDMGLLNLYLQLRINQPRIKQNEFLVINNILQELDNLSKWASTDIISGAESSFLNLFQIEKLADASEAIINEKKNVVGWENTFKSIKDSQTQLKGLLEKLEMKDPFLLLYTRNMISNYLKSVNENLERGQAVIAKLKPCFDILENSLKQESKKEDGYFLNRHVDFDDGKVLETKIT